MSKFLQIDELQIADQPLLVATLKEDMTLRRKVKGVEGCLVESLAEPAHLFGFDGDQRPETAEVIVRREFVGDFSNDLGFKRQANGNFQPIISEYDAPFYNASWLDRLSQKYGERKYIQEMYNNGFSLSNSETLADGSTEMSFIPIGGI